MQNDFVRQAPEKTFVRYKSVWQKLHIDPYLLFGLLALTVYGLVILYSASGADWGTVNRQAIRFAVGYIALIVIAQFDPRKFQQWNSIFYGVGIILLIMVLLYGTGAKGAQRWLSFFGFFRFQPSELMKLAVPTMIAYYLARQSIPPKMKHIGVAFILLCIPFGLIIEQPDLGTSLLIFSSGVFVIFLAGLSWRWLMVALIGVLSLLPIFWMFLLRDYQKQRVMTFLNPELDPFGAGWNIIQSKTAIGSGGVYGKGLLHGTQSQLDFLPESHTDFIIAVLSEELGFVGVLLLLSLYLFIIIRCSIIAIRGRDNFCRLLAGSLTLTFFIYIFVNIGMVSGLLPVVGVPLPLISYGGTSIVTLLSGFGILMSISTHEND